MVALLTWTLTTEVVWAQPPRHEGRKKGHNSLGYGAGPPYSAVATKVSKCRGQGAVQSFSQLRCGASSAKQSSANPFLGESCFLFSFQPRFPCAPNPFLRTMVEEEHAHPAAPFHPWELGEGDSRHNLTITLDE